MELVSSLGINATLGVQLGIFLLTYILMYFIAIKPYFKAYIERENKTVGQSELAERIIAETHDLHTEFETKARRINDKHRSIYDESRTQAMHAYDEKINAARTSAKNILESGKLKIAKEIETARKELRQQVPEISHEISSKLLGQERVL